MPRNRQLSINQAIDRNFGLLPELSWEIELQGNLNSVIAERPDVYFSEIATIFQHLNKLSRCFRNNSRGMNRDVNSSDI